MKYRNIIFDFDGTLVDTAALIVETMRMTIKRLSLPPKSDDECRAMIGYRLEEIPKILWPEFADLSDMFVRTYRDVFNSVKGSFRVELYPHVMETLSLLNERGINMAIASSRSRVSLKEYTTDLKIADFFQLLIGGEDVADGKPSPEPVNKLLNIKGWDKKETLVVGDMNVDILMGKRAATKTCGVTYGNGSENDLKEAGADYLISDFAELVEIV